MKRIAFITDIHLDEQLPKDIGVDSRKNLDWILNDIKSKNIDQLIFGGDIGEITSNKWFFESLKSLDLKIILGNHDQFTETSQYYKPHPGFNKSELYYSTETEFFKFIFLDSSKDELSLIQLAWLENELLTLKKIIIFIHHPVLPVNTAVDKLYPLKNRDQVKERLLKFENDVLLFCGHYHMSYESREENITQIITAASSYQIEMDPEVLKTNNQFFAYRIITIDENRVNSTLVTSK